MSDLENFTPKETADGTYTFFSKEFAESFHSHYGAKKESFLKFVEPTQLPFKATKPVLRLLDVCYGLGYNTAAALQTIWAINPNCYVEVIGLELNLAVPQAAIAHHLFDNWDYEHTKILTQLALNSQVQTERLTAKLLIGDARTTIGLVHQSGFRADAIFLDPFSPPVCPQLWTIEFIQQVSKCLHEDGLLATYSCAAAVRTALLAASLQIASTPPMGRRTPGTVAEHKGVGEQETGDRSRESGVGIWDSGGKIISQSRVPSPPFPIPHSPPLPLSPTPPSPHHPWDPLSQAEKEHLLTRAAIPYRDPQLRDPAYVILKRREQEQQACSLEPTSRWRKRWLLKND